MSETLQSIRLRGIRQNNLKGLNLDLPLGRFTVVTGLSGAGKSSLVFETLHAEGQRRYIETFSAYTRQFLDLLDRPKVDSIENIRPSIAIEQKNTVKTSRSTVGTMTELCDFFKAWFCQEAVLHDPADGRILEKDTPPGVWDKVMASRKGDTVLLTFDLPLPPNLDRAALVETIQAQGYSRIWYKGEVQRLETTELDTNLASLTVVQDRIRLEPSSRNRFLESIRTAFEFGRGRVEVRDSGGVVAGVFHDRLRSPVTGEMFKPARPALFSFNSPIGACPRCQGFGRVIEIDPGLVVPDETLSVAAGAIRPFRGEVYQECQRDLLKAMKRRKLDPSVSYRDLSPAARRFIWEGEGKGYEDGAAWYGINGFFSWLEKNTYKMQVRIFLARFRSYVTCPDCGGKRLCPEALNWKWRGHTLPDLYQLSIEDLLTLLEGEGGSRSGETADLAFRSILTRLRYLKEVGLGYLTLDRTSRSLSGGEVERVNLTTCLGTSLVDTLFVLDEPSVGLHARDVERLIRVLRDLTARGNTVVVVEHDESIIRAADHVLEIGPEPGSRGGQIVFSGSQEALLNDALSYTGRYLAGTLTVPPRPLDREILLKTFGPGLRTRNPRSAGGKVPALRIQGAAHHNLQAVSAEIPLQRFVCLSGVSGSGKSTLLNNVIFQGIERLRGRHTDDPAQVQGLEWDPVFGEVVRVDQSAVSRTPRSNPALFVDAWESIRDLFARTPGARQSGFGPGSFSFNSGDGRCDHCQGLGYERIEMQFLSDVFVPCPVCEGKRFKPEILAITWRDRSVAEVLEMDVSEALEFFHDQPKVALRLQFLDSVGLGYLKLGQPLNTLSGGESQRLKLVRHLASVGPDGDPALLLLDEPTTGLHRHDVCRLLGVFQELVRKGHSLIVIEHQMDVLKSADWILELGPGAGRHGGRIIAAGPPEWVARTRTETARFLADEGTPPSSAAEESPAAVEGFRKGSSPAEPSTAPTVLRVVGAREHNLQNLTIEIPHRAITVLTGVSGSGKSSLAFDIIFAEGQRRFMESMSAYARQFVEQLPRPAVDALEGIPPTVAIEQRVNRGTSKSTVATITEVAQYLRLLFARMGIQHSPRSGRPVVASSPGDLRRRLEEQLQEGHRRRPTHWLLCAPLVRSRKGHHQPLADWALRQGYAYLRCDGRITPLASFQRLDRYSEHDIELILADFGKAPLEGLSGDVAGRLEKALQYGKGTAFLLSQESREARSGPITWFSTLRSDPETGEAFPELDPKHFSWNSAKGWCPDCRGHGYVTESLLEGEEVPSAFRGLSPGTPCPTCAGDRLNALSRAVKLMFQGGGAHSLPELLRLTPGALLKRLDQLELDARGALILQDIRPQIQERLRFMDEVGLGYLSLDRATNTLSGGEAQRIRLASQLGSNLSGVLYILDEPSIGLHARDNAQLIQALRQLRDKGNTLLVVEHDEETIQAADHVIELGPEAGVHGGRLVCQGTPEALAKRAESLTGRFLREGIAHPMLGQYRALPEPWNVRRVRQRRAWLALREPRLRNLQGGILTLPKGRLTVVCGVSGAGKSTLIQDLLVPAAKRAGQLELARLNVRETDLPADAFDTLWDADSFRSVVEVDQNPIGKTPRSTPATYIGAFDLIREGFAQLPEARMRGWTSGTFSFNTPGGRCEVCKGAGRVKLEMNFLPDTYVDCDACGGKRYSPDILELKWRGKSVADVLGMSFEEAAEFFHFHTQLHALLQLMVETGLGYLTLGQSSPTLSGGEAQRLKLVSELARGLPTFRDRNLGSVPENLYLLEEPTIGLHQADCRRLLELLHRLVDQGHTVVVIEHHLDVIAEADYVVEIGPGGGDAGGRILFQGPVDAFRKVKASITAPYLATLHR